MRVALTIDLQSDFVPRRSIWFVRASDRYPRGRIEFLPAKEGGIKGTFQHQRRNFDKEPATAWLDGHPCLGDWARKVLREPTDRDFGSDRLRLLLRRLLAWTSRAADDDLARLGDPFELPQFTPNVTSVFAYSEDEESFGFWNSAERTDAIGIAQVAVMAREGEHSKVLVVRDFLDRSKKSIGHPLLHDKAGRSKWSTPILKADEGQAVWAMLDRVPVIPPWAAPTTWGELRLLLADGWGSLHTILRQNKGATLLLLGMPMPEEVGGAASQIHWQCLRVPPLIRKQEVKGWRPTPRLLREADLRSSFADDVQLEWVFSENWAPAQLSRRLGEAGDSYPEDVLIVGCGAVGGAVAETLARGGTKQIWLCDFDVVQGGNLVRGNYEVSDVGAFKATALADRLRRAFPHVKVTPLIGTYDACRYLRGFNINTVRWVFECTAQDEVLRDVADTLLHPEARVVSLSLSWEARRLLAMYSPIPKFDAEAAIGALDGMHGGERREATIVAEGIGCWSPAFPAAPHRVTVHAAMALERLGEWVRQGVSLVEGFDIETGTWSSTPV